MASPFAAAIAAAAAAHDAIMGETFEFRPFARAGDVNAREGADSTRATVMVRAVWGEPSARVDAGPARHPGVAAERPGHASSRPFLSLQLSRLPYAPRSGDRVMRVATNELFRVAEVLPSTPGFVRLDLNRI